MTPSYTPSYNICISDESDPGNLRFMAHLSCVPDLNGDGLVEGVSSAEITQLGLYFGSWRHYVDASCRDIRINFIGWLIATRIEEINLRLQEAVDRDIAARKQNTEEKVT